MFEKIFDWLDKRKIAWIIPVIVWVLLISGFILIALGLKGLQK